MIDVKLKLKDKNSILFFSLLGGFIICIIVFYFFFKSPKDFREMKNLSKEISSINLSMESSVKNNVVNTEKSISALKTNKEKLIEEKNKLTTITPTQNYLKLYDTFSKGLDNNINLYEQTIAILSTPNSNDINTAFENLNKFRDDCNEQYQICRKLGLPIYLEDNNISFFGNATNYINEIIKLKRDYDIKNSQKNDFLINLDKCLLKFSSLNEDLTPAIERVRNENKSLNVIIDDVNKKIVEFDSIKNSYYGLTVPEQGLECFNKLGELFSIYDDYISELLTALKDETENNNKDNKYYDNAFLKYKTLQNSLDEFDKIYDNYKNEK